MKSIIISCISVLFFFSCTENAVEQLEFDTQTAQQFTANDGATFPFFRYVPAAYENQEKTPLVIFLHGAGERGDSLDLVAFHGPAKEVKNGRNFPFILLSPQCPEGAWWDDFDQQNHIKQLIESYKENYNIDEDRIYMTGLSMGGFGTWAYGMNFPDEVAAIAPICGGGRPFRAYRLKDTPVWATHGTDDTVIPFSYSKELVDRVNEAGGNAKLTAVDSVGHLSWVEPYAGEELYDWLLSHKN